MTNEEIIEAIEDGMVTILWGDAWGKHADQHDCVDLPEEGEEDEKIAEFVPDPPEEAYACAKKLATMYATANDKTILELFMTARAADKAAGITQTDPEDFGSDIAFMALGDPEMATCWFDEHAQFELSTPSWDNSELEDHASKVCEQLDEDDDGDEDEEDDEEEPPPAAEGA